MQLKCHKHACRRLFQQWILPSAHLKHAELHQCTAVTQLHGSVLLSAPLAHSYTVLSDRLLFSTFTWYTQMSEMTPGFATSTVTPLWCSCSIERTEMRSQNEKKVRTSVQDHQQQSLGSHKSTSTFVPSVCSTRGDQDYVLIAVSGTVHTNIVLVPRMLTCCQRTYITTLWEWTSWGPCLL